MITDAGHVTVVLGLGSNCGDRYMSLKSAYRRLLDILDCPVCSSMYETPAVGEHAVGSYINAVVCGVTNLPSERLDSILKNLERAAGRDENARKRGEVPLDIDIVIYDDIVIRPRDYDQRFFQQGYQELSKIPAR